MLADNYYTILLIHSWLRWLVLIAGAASLGVALAGMGGGKPFRPNGRRVSLAYTASLDLQVLIGLVLYVISPIVHAALMDFGAAMKTQELRFFAVEHVTAMVIAVALAHVGAVRCKKAASDALAHRRMFVWNLLSLVAVLAGIPWWRPLFRGLVGG